jgi:hypothetical protein
MSHNCASTIRALEAATIFAITVAFWQPTFAQVIERPLPPNLVAPEVLRPLLTRMWRSSATFRRQCAQLAEHPEVTIRVALDPRTTHGRALSRVARREADLSASVQIEMRDPTRYIEYLAHELEHVLEQIEGLDLVRLKRQRVDGVEHVGGQHETARARSVGRTVARPHASRGLTLR